MHHILHTHTHTHTRRWVRAEDSYKAKHGDSMSVVDNNKHRDWDKNTPQQMKDDMKIAGQYFDPGPRSVPCYDVLQVCVCMCVCL
jgi:hypothetical protein